ncbi:MAG: type 4a pilus biogenesis protein PilO [Pirellulaceae bacterium]|nr:type 4a pilus biogenesis protein PilO [Pirellulaceae bacterium]
MKSDRKRSNRFHALAEHLRDPLKLRFFIAGVVLAVGYFGVFSPLEARIGEVARDLNRFKEHAKLSDEIGQLKAQIARVSKRVPKGTDDNEWLQYVLGGVRKHAVQLVKADPGEAKKVGPFEAAVVQVEIRGTYPDLCAFLDWIETNERLFRIDSINMSPVPRGDQLEMKLTLLGLRG